MIFAIVKHAPSVGRHNWVRRESTREEIAEVLLATKVQGTNRSGEAGRVSAL